MRKALSRSFLCFVHHDLSIGAAVGLTRKHERHTIRALSTANTTRLIDTINSSSIDRMTNQHHTEYEQTDRSFPTSAARAATILSSAIISTIAASSSSTTDPSSSPPSPSAPNIVPQVGCCAYSKPVDYHRNKRASITSEPPATARAREHLVHNGRVGQAGDDAFFISSDGLILGVADGVGGWSEIPGGNSAAYSKNLMTYALQHTERTLNTTQQQSTSSNEEQSSDTTTITTTTTTSNKLADTIRSFLPNKSSLSSNGPLHILQSAYNRIASDRIRGSTTACIVVYDPISSILHYANIGDSGFLLVRHPLSKRQNHVTAVQKQHGFNFPYQLGAGSSDQPHHAAVGQEHIEAGDILVLGTDGLFDNIHEEEIVTICRRYQPQQQQSIQQTDKNNNNNNSMTLLATELAHRAYRLGADQHYKSPFARAAMQQGHYFIGGKMDDITVIVAQFLQISSSASSTSDDSSQTPAERIRSKL